MYEKDLKVKQLIRNDHWRYKIMFFWEIYLSLHKGEENVAKNTKLLLFWLCEIVYNGFRDKFDLTVDTVNFLPGKGKEK